VEHGQTQDPAYRRIVLTITVYRSRSLARVSVSRRLGGRDGGWWNRGWSVPLGSDHLTDRPLTRVLYELLDAVGEEFQATEGTPGKI
jgi:hypothetical protein